MSRLARHQNKQFAHKTFILIGLFIALIIFFINFGFKLLINGSLFINQLANGNSPAQNGIKKEETLAGLTIDPPPTATNSSHLLVSGSTVNFDLVEIYLNEEKITDAHVTGDTFSEEITGLEKGDNNVYFIAKSTNSSQTRKSTDYTITYKSDKPKLEISEPSDNAKTNKQEIKVVGKTDRETYIKVNGIPVVVDAQGIFQTFYKLNDGDNTIEVIAEDIVGNQEVKSMKVTYSKDE